MKKISASTFKRYKDEALARTNFPAAWAAYTLLKGTPGWVCGEYKSPKDMRYWVEGLFQSLKDPACTNVGCGRWTVKKDMEDNYLLGFDITFNVA